MHVHVQAAEGEAKFWLEPEIELATNYHFSRKQLKELELLIEIHYDELVNSWKRHFGC